MKNEELLQLNGQLETLQTEHSEFTQRIEDLQNKIKEDQEEAYAV